MERGDRLGFECRCNACADELSFHNAMTAFCTKHGQDQDEIFTVVGDDTEDINDDEDAQKLIELHDRVFSDPTYYDYDLVVAMDPIAAIFIARSMDSDEEEPEIHLKSALKLEHQELTMLENCLGLEHERMKKTEKQIDDFKDRLEEVQGT
jgi:hypothetical protein